MSSVNVLCVYHIHVAFVMCACSHMTRVCLCQVSADWERASLRHSSQPSSVFKPSPVMGTYTTDGGFINTNLVTADEESQEFDDLIFALKTGEEPTPRTHKMCCALTHIRALYVV